MKAVDSNDCAPAVQKLFQSGKYFKFLFPHFLEIYTSNHEFACPQDTNSALTPGSFSIRQQSAYGCSKTIKPISYINDSYYVSRTGTAIVNFHFTGVGLSYESTNS